MFKKTNDEQNTQNADVDQEKVDELVEATLKAVQEDSGADASASDTITVSRAEYEKLKSDLEEAKDRGLRALAELENFRARTNRLAQEERKYASMNLARDVLSVWDNLGLALNIAEPEKNVAAVVEGVKMVRQELLNIFTKNNIEKIDALHKPFDPNFHESVAFVPNDEFAPNTVVVELKDGFKLHERVVRASQVVLAAPVPKKEEPKDETKQEQ